MEKVSQFTFCVLVYNHQEYILEHLESIKFLIEKYGEDVTCNIIINDDCSKDKSCALVDAWLSDNDNLFGEVVKLYNTSNVGTCTSLVNIAEKIRTKHCKITAGDDVYSFHDIFSFVSSYSEYDLLSGIPIRVIDGKVEISSFEVFNYFASDIVYKSASLTDRLINVSVVSAPNMFYSTKYLKDVEILNFISKFDVVEDWPFQIAISLKNKLPQSLSLFQFHQKPGLIS